MKFYSLLVSIALTCCCSAAGPPGPPGPADPPLIRLNSDFLPNRTELVLRSGSAFTLSCHGNRAVRLSSTALRLAFMERLPDPLEVSRSEPRHTGTYRCLDPGPPDRETWIHLYVSDPADPSSVFVTPRRLPDAKEGEDFLFRCLVTDPALKNLTVQSEDGSRLPPGMAPTLDPRRGALIRALRRTWRGRYVCSGWKDGRNFRSRPLILVPRPVDPPEVWVSDVDVVRLEGEELQVSCEGVNPSHAFNLTWTGPKSKKLKGEVSRHYSNGRLYITSRLTLPVVTATDAGRFTCTAANEAGVATATTHLTVLDAPYLRIYLQPVLHANANSRTVNKAPVANASSSLAELAANASSSLAELAANASSSLAELAANASSSLAELAANASSLLAELEANVSDVKGKLVANVSANRTAVNGSVSVSGVSTVEVYEGRDVALSFLMEAYPPIRTQRWMTSQTNAEHRENNTASGYSSASRLLLRRVRLEDRGRYSLSFNNQFFNGTLDVDLRVYHAPDVEVSLQNDTLTCSSSGYPLPTILWATCPGLRDTCGDSSDLVPAADVTSQEEEVMSCLTLPPPTGDDVTVECVASNQLGVSRDVITRRAVGNQASVPLIGALSVSGFLLLLLLIAVYKWRQKPRYELRWKIIESSDDGNVYSFVDPSLLPYDEQWEFPRDKLFLGAVVGSGAFGKVVEATAFGLETGKATRVAVKMLKPRAHWEEREALMSELKILGHLGYHDNIVNLLGACTRGGPMLVITEYCCHGDLLNFLRAHADDIMASLPNDGIYKNMAARLRSDSGISCCSQYQEMQPILSPGQTQPGVSVGDLMRFSFEVAQGLDFLSSRNCIHRDVAARNVLLTDRCVAKICDFGLARDIKNDDSYIVQGNARLPVKWMSPESIFRCVYTVQSDVWSYGVLLWETFSLGKSPYPNIAVDSNFYKMIQDGRHMDRPDFAPEEMFELMKLCWSLEPTDRPTFKMIGHMIHRLLPSNNEQATYKNIREEEEESRGDSVRR